MNLVILSIIGALALFGFLIWLALGAVDILQSLRRFPRERTAILAAQAALEHRSRERDESVRALESAVGKHDSYLRSLDKHLKKRSE
jgi:hypothetical protein